MYEHFIQNIEIKNFKCFEDFKAENFERINLIGGKNNVGKTAFMEACYLISKYATTITNHKDFTLNYGASSIDREWMTFEIIKSLIVIQQNRETVDFLTEWIKDETQLTLYHETEIILNDKFAIELDQASLIPLYKYNNWANYTYIDNPLIHFRENKFFHSIYKKNNLPQIINTTFVSPCNQSHLNMRDMIDTLKLNGLYNEITIVLASVFHIEKIDIIKNKVMCYQDNKFQDINDFGYGLKHFLNIILVLLVNNNSIIYLDEIDNGIHYSNIDKLWQVILTISKRHNIQVFATTHSKECIESYARVSKKLKDDEITFLDIGRKNDGSIAMITMDYTQLQEEVEMENEVRGW
jgi:AAA15 family ATPase/GTPase